MAKRKRGLRPAAPQQDGSVIAKGKKKKNSAARKRARAELLQAQGTSSSARAAACKPTAGPEEVLPESPAKKAKKAGAPPEAKQAPALEPESSDEAGSESGTGVSSDEADEGEVKEFIERLKVFLKKHGETHIGIIGRKVPRPEALKLGKFFASHKDQFKVTAGKISLIDRPAAAADAGARDAGVRRPRPNILVTGTPGVGKTTFCKTLADSCGLAHIEVSKMVTEEKLYKEWDDEMNCSIFDDELVGDALEPKLEAGGAVVDFHSSGWMAEDWFDLVLVLRADTKVLWSRLEARGYSEAKIKGNMDAEIFQTCLEEARELFSAEDEETSSVPIWECSNNTTEERDTALERVRKFIDQWGSS